MQGVAFLLVGRLLPLAFFSLLLVLQAQALAPDISRAWQLFPDFLSTLNALNAVLQVAFVAGVALIYLMRKPPEGRRHEPLAVLIAFYASFVLLTVGPLQRTLGISSPKPPTAVLLLSSALVLAGLAITVYSLAYLRLSFSIMPESRQLITGGPYRLVRHPIYLGEITTGLGIVLAAGTWFVAAVWLSFIVAQVVRTRFEESVLTGSFPEYAAYAGRTKRVIPWLV
jgi:protein-S-isoprenylcysteine O-methyltransferase Ste14